MALNKYQVKPSHNQHDTCCCTSALTGFHQWLNRIFYSLGDKVARYKGYFILIPIFITILSATGFQRIYYEDDPEYLFAPTTGPARGERAVIEKYFHINYSSFFDPARVTRTGRFARFIIKTRDGGTIFRQSIWRDIMALDNIVKSLTIEHDDKVYNFKDLCAIYVGKCYKNTVLDLNSTIEKIEDGSSQIMYPRNSDPFLIPHFFGGIELDSRNQTIVSAKAIILYYWIKTDNDEQIIRGEKWEKKVLQAFDGRSFDQILVAYFTSTTLEDELENNTSTVKPFVAVTLTIMIVFCVFAAMEGDWVRAKPYLGIVGVVTSVFSSFTAFGILIYIGVPFIGINMAAPFLMLGIGIDDTFVMLAAWRRTKIQDSIPKRLAETYSEAAVSITITSLTDMISFFIGVITPFPSVQIFCLYTGVAVFFTYAFHITFFGSCLAMAGYAESNQRHSLLGVRVKAKSETEGKNWFYTTFIAGGVATNDPWNPRDNKDHAIMAFFRDYIGTCLNIPAVKTFVISVFLLYLGGAIYGCTRVKEGLEKRRLSRYDSYSVQYYDFEDEFFRVFPYSVQVAITGNVTYSDPQTRLDIMNLIATFENETFIYGGFTRSVIRDFYYFLEDNKEYLEFTIPDGDEKFFIQKLKDEYVSDPTEDFSLDLKYNEDYTQILASRFILQTYKLTSSNADKDMMERLRAIAGESKFNVTLFNPYFVFFDQLVLVRSLSIQAISLAAVVMMVVAVIFIPNTWCSMWVAFSIISIEAGVIGYMSMWNVSLDSISMINLIMCIGFSVDFSAHISYAYLTSKSSTVEEKIKECLFNLGLPILQGGFSTILGVIPLIMAPSYIFLTFFRIVFLVIFFGIMHGIFLLPVLLSLMGPGGCCSSKSKRALESHNKIYLPHSINDTYNKQRQNLKNECKETREKVILQSGAFLATNHSKPTSDKYCENPDKDMGLGTSGEDSSEASLQEIREIRKTSDAPFPVSSASYAGGIVVREVPNGRIKHQKSSLEMKEVYNNKAFVRDNDEYEARYNNGYGIESKAINNYMRNKSRSPIKKPNSTYFKESKSDFKERNHREDNVNSNFKRGNKYSYNYNNGK